MHSNFQNIHNNIQYLDVFSEHNENANSVLLSSNNDNTNKYTIFPWELFNGATTFSETIFGHELVNCDVIYTIDPQVLAEFIQLTNFSHKSKFEENVDLSFTYTGMCEKIVYGELYSDSDKTMLIKAVFNRILPEEFVNFVDYAIICNGIFIRILVDRIIQHNKTCASKINIVESLTKYAKRALGENDAINIIADAVTIEDRVQFCSEPLSYSDIMCGVDYIINLMQKWSIKKPMNTLFACGYENALKILIRRPKTIKTMLEIEIPDNNTLSRLTALSMAFPKSHNIFLKYFNDDNLQFEHINDAISTWFSDRGTRPDPMVFLELIKKYKKYLLPLKFKWTYYIFELIPNYISTVDEIVNIIEDSIAIEPKLILSELKMSVIFNFKDKLKIFNYLTEKFPNVFKDLTHHNELIESILIFYDNQWNKHCAPFFQ